MKSNNSILKKNQFISISHPVSTKEVYLWLIENDNCYSIFMNVVWRFKKDLSIFDILRKEYIMPKSNWERKDVLRRYSNMICKYRKLH